MLPLKGFKRSDLDFSLCGLNCALCPMKLGTYCPGCGGGEGNQSCKIAACSVEHKVEYCFLCAQYPCAKYEGIQQFDSFVTHQHQLKDVEYAKTMGLPAYHELLSNKRAILEELLYNWNEGRRKTLFGLAVNLLPLGDLQRITNDLNMKSAQNPMTKKEAADFLTASFLDAAVSQGIELKLRKKM